MTPCVVSPVALQQIQRQYRRTAGERRGWDIDGIPLDDSLDLKEAFEVGYLEGADHKENS